MAGALARRQLTPELLDSLPIDDRRAVASRRDLVRVNALMFQSAILAGLFREHLAPQKLRVLEIGAGDGSFMLSVARRLGSRWGDVDLTLLDMADLVTARRIAQFAALGWRVKTVTMDIFDWTKRADLGAFDVVSSNLFLHHFNSGDLAQLLKIMATLAPVFLATEPQRSRVALWSTALLRFVGANDVTLHDAAVSVRAGFAGRELSAAWPARADQVIQERRIGPFSHAFAVTAKVVR